MTALEILTKARELISDPEHWCQQQFARTKTNGPTAALAHDACKWCVRGALAKVAGTISISDAQACNQADVFLQKAAHEWRHAINNNPTCACNVYLNDHGTHADVLAMFDRAIELAKAN